MIHMTPLPIKKRRVLTFAVARALARQRQAAATERIAMMSAGSISRKAESGRGAPRAAPAGESVACLSNARVHAHGWVINIRSHTRAQSKKKRVCATLFPQNHISQGWRSLVSGRRRELVRASSPSKRPSLLSYRRDTSASRAPPDVNTSLLHLRPRKHLSTAAPHSRVALQRKLEAVMRRSPGHSRSAAASWVGPQRYEAPREALPAVRTKRLHIDAAITVLCQSVD